MKKLFFLSSLFAILFFSGCGSSVRVFHDLDPAISFDQFKTYSFLNWSDGNLRSLSEFERERIKVAIAREIESMGITFQEQNADIKIQVNIYFRNARRHRHHYYGYPGISYTSNQRALSVDIFEGETKKHIWHSAAVGYIEFSAIDEEVELSVVVSKLFEEYPGKRDI